MQRDPNAAPSSVSVRSARRSGISRRTFLAGSVSTAVALFGLRSLAWAGESTSLGGLTAAAKPLPDYARWEDVYRQRWTWDRVVKSTHFVNCWYQSSCAWNVYVKDGMVWREEQVAQYPRINPKFPDPNPRGCQKGACYSHRMYDPTRLNYPLKRVGERGSGQWQRVSWDEALDTIADDILDTLEKDGSDRVVWELGPLYTEGAMAAGHQRLAVLLDSTNLDMNTEIGDGHRGAAETFGKIVFERSADDYFYSDLILIWGGNPLYTQIPNAHYLTEARYHGAKLVCIAPDYSASSIHADLYVPVKPGCDAALALAVAHVLVEEGRIDRAFLGEQTDFPLLVREDTRRFLRSEDLVAGGRDDELYVHDSKGALVATSRRSLDLGGVEPDLEGTFEATLKDRTKVRCSTVFSLLRARLAAFPPEKAAELCGTPVPVIRTLAKLFADASAASMVTTSNFSKYYHGNLIERCQALVFALAGQYGRKGTGFVAFPWLDQDGFEQYIRDMFSVTDMMNPVAMKIIGKTIADTARWKLDGLTDEMISYENSRNILASGAMTSGALFWYVHGGLIHASAELQTWDPYAKRPVREYLRESFEKNWQSLWPRPGNDPKMMFVLGSNPLRRVRGFPYILKHLWPKLRTVVTLDVRMTSTAMHSDYVLPVSAWYERNEHKWATPLHPYIHAGEKAASYYESKSDWEVCSRLAMAVDRRARKRGVQGYTDRNGNARPLDNLYEKFSQGGLYGPEDDDKVCDALLERASNVGGIRWDELKEKGFARFTAIGHGSATVGNMTDVASDDSITPLTKHVLEKVPYPTLSRRMQFYLDQDLYLELGEELPTHKDPPKSGGDYPLMLTGGHTRWSIHSSWRDDALMLHQQRGEPVMYLSVADARARGIADGARVRVYNDIDEFEILAKVAPSVRPGQIIIYHAWENFQFKNGKGFQNLMPAPLNPVELAGGQFHLRPMVICLQPSHSDRDTRVEVALV